MNQNIVLNKNHIDTAIEFAKKFWDAGKSSRDFGSEDVRKSESDKLADTISGKLAEIAFSLFAKREFDIDIKLDFEIMEGKLEIDNGQDIKLIDDQEPFCRADIKGSKKIARWLLVEQHKISDLIIDSDFYISVSLDLPTDIEEDWNKFVQMNTIAAQIDGYIKKRLFFDKHGIPWFDYIRGNRLYSISYVEYVIDRMARPFFANDLKSSLLKETKEFDGKIYMGGPLKATRNIGMPKQYLKSEKNDFEVLFSILSGAQEGKCH